MNTDYIRIRGPTVYKEDDIAAIVSRLVSSPGDFPCRKPGADRWNLDSYTSWFMSQREPGTFDIIHRYGSVAKLRGVAAMLAAFEDFEIIEQPEVQP